MYHAKGRGIHIRQVPPREYGLLLGTTPQSRVGRKQNQFFTYCIDAAEKLYKVGKSRRYLSVVLTIALMVSMR